MNNLIQILKGGSGSGDWGHVGRAGKRGGSGGGGGKGKSRRGRRSREALNKEIEVGKEKSTSGKVTNDVRNLKEDKNIKKLHKNFKDHATTLSVPNHNTVKTISESSNMEFYDVNGYVRNWNVGNFALMHYTAQSAVRSLGAKFSSYEIENKDKWQNRIDSLGIPDFYKDDYDKITKTVYDETQKQLKDMGITEIILYRGMSGSKSDIPVGGVGNYESNSLDSWTTDIEIAREFSSFADSGFIMKSSIPAERIFSMSSSGPGTSFQNEIIVIGSGDDEVLIAE